MENEVDYSAYSAGRCQYHIVSAPNFPGRRYTDI